MDTTIKTIDDLLGEVDAEYMSRGYSSSQRYRDGDDLLDYTYEKYWLNPEDAPKAEQIVDDYEEAIWDARHA